MAAEVGGMAAAVEEGRSRCTRPPAQGRDLRRRWYSPNATAQANFRWAPNMPTRSAQPDPMCEVCFTIFASPMWFAMRVAMCFAVCFTICFAMCYAMCFPIVISVVRR